MSITYTNRKGQVDAPPRSFPGMEDLEDEVGMTAAELEATETRPLAQRRFHRVDTAAQDKRFMNTNQSRHCFFKFNQFLACKKNNGEANPECLKIYQAMQTLCPQSWVESWTAQVEEGTFPGIDA